MEKLLFEILRDFGYDMSFDNRYKMITQFYQKRIPYIILILGTECIGKSTLVTQLGERINMSNIV
jgi:2-phosphoglycerate kinase